MEGESRADNCAKEQKRGGLKLGVSRFGVVRVDQRFGCERDGMADGSQTDVYIA